MQPIRLGLAPFAAALTAFVEAHRDEDADKNRLCPPNPYPDTALDWARSTLIGMQADYRWSQEADIAEWLERSRLNTTCGLRARSEEPEVQRAWQLFVDNVRPALTRLAELVQQSSE